MATQSDVPQFDLQMFVSMRFDAFEALLDERGLRYDEKFDAIKTALELQAKEYERRLAALNHEAEQLKSMQINYVPRETYVRDLEESKKEIKTLVSFKDNLTGRMVVFSAVYAFVIAIIFVSINFALRAAP